MLRTLFNRARCIFNGPELRNARIIKAAAKVRQTVAHRLHSFNLFQLLSIAGRLR